MMSCAWLRTLLNQWIYLINIASVLAAFTDPLLCNVVSLICTSWFPTQQQIIALTIITVFSVLGPIGGSFYSLLFIDSSIQNTDVAKHMMFDATFYLAVTYTGICVLAIIFFRGKPDIAPWYTLQLNSK